MSHNNSSVGIILSQSSKGLPDQAKHRGRGRLARVDENSIDSRTTPIYENGETVRVPVYKLSIPYVGTTSLYSADDIRNNGTSDAWIYTLNRNEFLITSSSKFFNRFHYGLYASFLTGSYQKDGKIYNSGAFVNGIYGKYNHLALGIWAEFEGEIIGEQPTRNVSVISGGAFVWIDAS